MARFQIVEFVEKPSELASDPPQEGCVYLREGEAKGDHYESRVLGLIEVPEQHARHLCGLTQLTVDLDSTSHANLPHTSSSVRDSGRGGLLPSFHVMARQALDAASDLITEPALGLKLIEDRRTG